MLCLYYIGGICAFMQYFWEYISCWFVALRAYSLPISIMSWTVPFLFGAFDGGNILFGFLAFLGIVILHLGSNLFDDTVDYLIADIRIKKGLQSDFNFQPGKCICIFSGKLLIKDYIIACIILFLIALLIGLIFIYIYGIKLFIIIIPTAILCILYPILGSLGFGEILIAIIFAPMIYLGTYFVMCGHFSLNILILSISTGLLTVAVLHNHMLLDYKIDSENKKITLCRICRSPINAYYLLFAIVSGAYLNILICILLKILNPIYLITLLSIPTAFMLLKVMKKHITNPEVEVKRNIFMGFMPELKTAQEKEKNFLTKFLLVRNLIFSFTLLLCIAIAVEKCI